MDHLALIKSTGEIETLVSGKRSMLAWSASGAKNAPCDIHPGDSVYFAVKSGVGFVIAQALVKNAFSTKDQRKKPVTLLNKHRGKLNFNDSEIKRWSKKSNIMFVELAHARQLKPFAVNLCGLSDKRPLVGIDYLNQIRIS